MRSLLALAIVFTAAVASADDALTRSNTLFDEGKKLMGEGRIAEACARFDESYRLSPRGGTLLNLGLCHEQEGKLLAARRELRDALAMAKRDGRADREPVASEHLAAVEAKLSWIAVTPPQNVRDVEVRVDGAPIDRRDWDAVAVEAGTHLVRVTAAGYRPRETSVVLEQTQRKAVRFEPLEDEPAVRGTPPPPRRDVVTPPASSPSKLKAAALVTGIAGIGLSLAAGAWALERQAVVKDHCDANKECDSTGDSAASTARVLVIASTVVFAVGAVGFGAWLLLPSSSRTTSGGVSVTGTF